MLAHTLTIHGVVLGAVLALGSSTATAESKADELFALGQELLESGDCENARDAFSFGLEQEQRTTAVYLLARSHVCLGDFDRASTAFAKFLEIAPDQDYRRIEAARFVAMQRPVRPDSRPALVLEKGDSETANERLYRRLFTASATGTVLSLATVVYSVTRVDDATKRKSSAAADVDLANIEGSVDEFARDACAAADNGQLRGDPAAGPLQNACADGQRWARIGNIMMLATLTTTAATAWTGYRWRRAKREAKERNVLVAPVLSPDSIGVGVTLNY